MKHDYIVIDEITDWHYVRPSPESLRRVRDQISAMRARLAKLPQFTTVVRYKTCHVDALLIWVWQGPTRRQVKGGFVSSVREMNAYLDRCEVRLVQETARMLTGANVCSAV